MRIAALVLLMVMMLAFGALSLPPDELYPVDIHVATTSDWTEVRIQGATMVVDSYEVVEGAEAFGLQVSAGASLSVVKGVYDETLVTVRFQGHLADLSDDWIQLWVAKGHIGETTVWLQATEDSAELASFHHRGVAPGDSPDNARTFPLSTSQITSQIAPLVVEAPSETLLGGQKVLAFYYPWYGTPDGPSGEWVHWNPYQGNYASTHRPSSGYYDSLDPETVRRHIREAQGAGIDGFIASWWGMNSFEDRAFRVLLEVAEEEGFLVCPYYEDAKTPQTITTEVAAIVSRYGSSSAFLKVDALPVVFFYVRVISRFSLAQWESVFTALDNLESRIFAIADSLQPEYLSVFQGLHTYNPVALTFEETTEQYATASLASRMKDSLFAATVLPGYEEAFFRSSSPRSERADGETYHTYWELARASKAHWILITSFNEWHEGSEIEPSDEFGRAYLDQTAMESAAWRAGEIPDEQVDDDRDGDGVPDGEDYCPDWPGSAAANGC